MHVRQGKTGILDFFFERFLADKGDTDLQFMDWVENIYDREALKSQFKSGRVGGLITEGILRRE